MVGAPRIIVLSEQLRGQPFELVEDRYTIGRGEDCDICIPDPTVSSRHCVLSKDENGEYTVQDQGSTNGTLVNGVRVEGEAQVLTNADVL